MIKWSGAADRFLKYVQYSLDGGSYFVMDTAASGSFTIPSGKITTSGRHIIKVRAVDKAGNVSAAKTLYYYADIKGPQGEDVKLVHQDGTELEEWTQKKDLKVSFSGIIEDASGMIVSGIQYAVVEDGSSEEPAYKNPSNPVLENTDSSYSGSFLIHDEDYPQKTGKYYIYVKLTDKSGNSTVYQLPYGYDKDKPTCSITVKDSLGKTVTDLLDTVHIIGDVSDGKGSGIKTSSIKLMQGENLIATVYDNATVSKSQAFNTELYDNGTYTLHIEAEDLAGNRSVAEKTVKIVNRFSAPKLKGSMSNQTTAQISWEFVRGDSSKIQKLQYKLEADESWNDITSEIGLKGSFILQIPDEEGTHKVLVRAVDKQGIAGEESVVECILDKTVPEVTIDSYERGILKGSIQDKYLNRWEVQVKEKSAADSEYEVILRGNKEIKNSNIGIVCLDEFVVGNEYTIQIVAYDKAGNKKTAQHHFTKSEEDQTVRERKASFRIKRPGDQEDEEEMIFIPSHTTKIELKSVGSDALPNKGYVWYIDNKKVGEEQNYQDDFSLGENSKYKEKEEHLIRAAIVKSDGKLEYSNRVLENKEGYQIELESTGKKELKLTESCVSFILEADTVDAQENTITWKMDVGDGSYKQIEPTKRYDIYTLTDGKMLETDTIKIQAVGDGKDYKDINCNLYTDVLDRETFEVSEIENYYPHTLSVKDALNYKTYVKWQGVDTNEEWPEAISYEVYRGTESGFTPSKENLAAADLKSNYWSEVNINYSSRFYYRVRAVRKDKDGKITGKSSFSKEISSAVIDSDEYTKRMGVKDYWEYAEIGLPNGDVNIEKSGGNLVYTQKDVEIPNEQLEVVLSRTYNSQSSAKSAFGVGWNHSFDMEILNICEDDSLEFNTVVLKDGYGTVYRFEKKDDGSYISSMGKYINLKKEEKTEDVKLPKADSIGVGKKEETVTVRSAYTITTKDNDEYRFNSGGQMVYMSESNGNFLLFEYEPDKGLLSRIVTSKNISMELSYHSGARNETDPLTVKQISLPDGSFMEYQYEKIASEWRLKEAIHHGTENGKTIYYCYNYSDNGKLSAIDDALGAKYQINYDGNKVKEFIWPDSEKIRLTYSPSENQTVTEKISDGAVVLKETDQFDSYFGNCVRSVDAEGYVTEYVYEDNLLKDTLTQMDYQSLENGRVVYQTTTKKETTTYAENQNITSEEEEDGSVTSYTYNGDSAGEILDDLIKTEKEVDGDGNVLYDHIYEYDEYGNITSVYDQENETTVLTTYYTKDDESKGQIKGEVESEQEILGTASDGDVQSSISYTYTYDEAGNKTEVSKETVDGITLTTTTVTDVMGRTLHEEDSNQKQTDYVYDGFGRLIKTTYTYSDGATDVIEKKYNDNGALIWEREQDGTENSYTYDNMNRVVGETVKKDTLTKEWTTSYGYQNISVYDGTGMKNIPHSFVTTEKNPDGFITGQTFQDSNGRTVRELSNGIYVDMSYDGQDNVVTKCEVGKEVNPENQLLIIYIFSRNRINT